VLAGVAALAAAAFLWTRIDVGWRLSLVSSLADWARGLGWQPAETRLDRWVGSGSPARQAYLRWLGWWPRLGLKPSSYQTPAERARMFAAAFPAMAGPASAIADAYAAERFGGRAAPSETTQSSWKKLAPLLWRTWLDRWSLHLRRWAQDDPASESR
jgi:hypothetical protein